jgi:hypothetical protein
MGLDMYLSKKHYVKNWDHMEPDRRYAVSVRKGGKRVSTIKPERISYIVEEIAYWRKANQIHRWFVENVQEGNDDCKAYRVSKEQLKELLDSVTTVLQGSKLVAAKITNGYTVKSTGTQIIEEPILQDGKTIVDPSVASALLPTQKGFFFGHTDYDQFYIEDLEHTRDALTAALAEAGNSNFYYQSSW